MNEFNGNRIKAVRNALGLTQEEFGKRLGSDGPNVKITVSSWETGRRQPTKIYGKIANEFGVSLNWLMTGNGEMFDKNDSEQNACLIKSFDDKSVMPIAPSLLGNFANSPELLRYIVCRWDSMTPTIRQNDVLIMDIFCQKPIPDEIFLISIDGSMILRRVVISDGNTTTFSADNQIYTTLVLPKEKFRVVGKVLWCSRLLAYQ